MNRSQFSFAIGTAAALALIALGASASHADGGYFDASTGTFYEQDIHGNGDAGSVTSTADILTGYPVQHISGTLFGLADLYEINIGVPGSFSASVNNLATTVANPQLFLFNSSGDAVAMAVANGIGGATFTYNTIKAAGDTLTAGEYYLGVAAYNYQPMSGSKNLFGTGGAGTTILASDNTDVLKSWALDGGTNIGGSYVVNLSGVTATPEPGMIVTGFAMFGATGLCLIKGRRSASRKSQDLVG